MYSPFGEGPEEEEEEEFVPSMPSPGEEMGKTFEEEAPIPLTRKKRVKPESAIWRDYETYSVKLTGLEIDYIHNALLDLTLERGKGLPGQMSQAKEEAKTIENLATRLKEQKLNRE